MSPNLAEATKAGITAGKTSVSRLSHRQQYGTSRHVGSIGVTSGKRGSLEYTQ